MDDGTEGVVGTETTVAVRKGFDEPLPSVDILVQLQLPELGDHLAQVQWPHAQLGELPVDDPHRGLRSLLDRLVRQQNADGLSIGQQAFISARRNKGKRDNLLAGPEVTVDDVQGCLVYQLGGSHVANVLQVRLNVAENRWVVIRHLHELLVVYHVLE